MKIEADGVMQELNITIRPLMSTDPPQDPPAMTAPTYFDSAAAFRGWLEANAATAAELDPPVSLESSPRRQP